ncbi:MAG: hypothetical protein ACO1QB_05430 [Verrucomicrobiales bacterium]
MNLVDFILNIIGLLMWINWRTAWVMKRRRSGISISGAIKRTDPQPGSEWTSIASLLTLLLFRAVFYWNLGPALKWTATINLVPVSLAIRSDLFPLMLVYSFASFALTLGLFYSWLLLLSSVNKTASQDNVIQRFVRLHLGVLDRQSAAVKLGLPPIVSALAWICLAPMLKHYGILPPPVSNLHLLEQGMVVGLSAILAWRGILIVIILAHIVNTYIFLGNHHVWEYVELTATRLLGPLKPLRWKALDLGSILLLSTLILLSYILSAAFTRMFALLPW